MADFEFINSEGKCKDGIADAYLRNAQAPRINTDALILLNLEQAHPDKEITIVPEYSCNLLMFAQSGHATAIPDRESNATNSGPLEWNMYLPAGRRLDGGSGSIGRDVLFGKYKYIYGDYEFILYVIEGRDGSSAYPTVRNNYLISTTANSAKSLILAAGDYGNTLHGEIWVFDGGFWQKDAGLWDSIQNSSWDNVILDANMKKSIIRDITRFFDGQETYKRLKVPWKRGIIYHGPPGNGKTISIKATMNMLYKRKEEVPTLFSGPEYSLNEIFQLARATAPCYLVFEDLDSIVSDEVRSFFLNQVDGLNNNDGILMVGSTNHLDRLDPGISKRPSRFDRKYLFPNPNFDERVLYAEFWRKKLLGDGAGADDDKLEFPEELCKAIARITKNFSFAYMQEAFVASLLAIASKEIEDDGEEGHRVEEDDDVDEEDFATEEGCGIFRSANLFDGGQDTIFPNFRRLKIEASEGNDKDLQRLVLWREFKAQVKILKEEMGETLVGGYLR